MRISQRFCRIAPLFLLRLGVVAVSFLIFVSPTTAAEKRVALVIGNNDYQYVDKLGLGSCRHLGVDGLWSCTNLWSFLCFP